KSKSGPTVTETTNSKGKKTLIIAVDNDPKPKMRLPEDSDPPPVKTKPRTPPPVAESKSDSPPPVIHPTETHPPPSTSSSDNKGDCWTRLKAKLSNGQMTGGTEEFRK